VKTRSARNVFLGCPVARAERLTAMKDLGLVVRSQG
jgi:hypothetical protein